MVRFVLMLTGVVGMLFSYGCDNSGNSSKTPVTAAVSFTVSWQDEIGGGNTGKTEDALTSALSDDCAGRGVASIVVQVNNSSGGNLSTGTFDCNARQGTLSGITPGSGYTIIVSGLNNAGTVTYRGQKTGITLNPGPNAIGTLLVARINNQNPVAAITSPANGFTYQSGAAITFSGTGTDTEDGQLSGTYLAWTSNRDGQIGTGTSCVCSLLSPGSHTITLTVTDRDGATGSTNISITIGSAANQSPIATISNPVNNSTYSHGQSITFTGSGTDPEDGTLPASAFVWTSSLNGQINSGSKSFSIATLSAGTHTITLTVTDSGGGKTSVTVMIMIQNGIVADAGPDQVVDSGVTVQLTGSWNAPDGGVIRSYQWQKISGPSIVLSGSDEMAPETTKEIMPSFRAPVVASGQEILVFQFTIKTDSGASVSDEMTVTVNSSTLQPSITNSIGMTFNYIPPGTFMMGSPSDEPGRDSDETQHQVTLTQAYYIQTTEVTQGQWVEVMGNNPSYFKSGDNYPVETVSWNDIQGFIANMNLRGDGTYSLPTEAQWEYAAKAGSPMAFPNGDCTYYQDMNACNFDSNLAAIGWFCYNSNSTTHPVAQKTPNTWGLYDMHGNVWEWCADWYETYPSSSVTDPTGPSSGINRVLRGGDWNDYARNCRSADRGSFGPPGYRSYDFGFRLVLLPANNSNFITLSYEGTVASTGGTGYEVPTFKIGDTFRVTYTFDSTTSDGNSDPTVGQYSGAIKEFFFSVGSYNGYADSGASVQVGNNYIGQGGSKDYYFINIESSTGLLHGPTVSGWSLTSFRLCFDDPTAAAFTSDDLPVSKLNPDRFIHDGWTYIEIGFRGPNGENSSVVATFN